MNQRALTAEEDWREAVELKRRRAYLDVVKGTGWSLDQVDAIYQQEWAPKGIDFHEMMLKKQSEGCEMLVWDLEGRMVAYAALRTTPLCSEAGPTLCTSGEFLMEPDLTEKQRDQIVKDVLNWGNERGASVYEFFVDAADQPAFERAGLFAQKVAMRKHPESLAGPAGNQALNEAI